MALRGNAATTWNVARSLERRQLLFRQSHQAIDIGCTVASDDERGHRLAPLVRRQPDDCYLSDRWVTPQDCLDLGRDTRCGLP